MPEKDDRAQPQAISAMSPVSPKLRQAEIRAAHTARGTIACPFCGGSRYRRSRLHGAADYLEFLMLRYPVRCMNCNQRQYSYLLTALLAHAAKDYR